MKFIRIRNKILYRYAQPFNTEDVQFNKSKYFYMSVRFHGHRWTPSMYNVKYSSHRIYFFFSVYLFCISVFLSSFQLFFLFWKMDNNFNSHFPPLLHWRKQSFLSSPIMDATLNFRSLKWKSVEVKHERFNLLQSPHLEVIRCDSELCSTGFNPFKSGQIFWF